MGDENPASRPLSNTLILGRLDAPGRSGASHVEFLRADGRSHALTLAPNRSSRVRYCLIPNLLTYPGCVVAVDLDGEAYTATADARRRMGHTVVRLDPFGVAGPESDALDPLDLLNGLEEAALSSACQDLADLFTLRTSYHAAAQHEAFSLLSAVIGYLSAVPERHSFDEIYTTMHQDDVVYGLAVVLDTIGKKIPKMSYAEIGSFLQMEDASRNRIAAEVRGQLLAFGSPEVRRTLRDSSFSLVDLAAGEPYTVYLILPAERLPIHAVLLRLWIGTLLLAASRARGRTAAPPLFLLDHCAELGTLPVLEALLRTGSADACRIWSFWHDVYQLRTVYPLRWPEIVSGADAVQVFGTADAAAAGEAASLLGLTPNEIGTLGPAEQVVRLGGAARRVWRTDARDLPLTNR